MRTSDRLFMEVPIIVSGADPTGKAFVEKTRALVLSRRGARIIAKQPLIPQQTLKLRCMKTGMDTSVRVVGPIMGESEGCHYGIAFLEPELNVWGIEFPTLDGTENPAGRMVLECTNCHAQEVVHLDVFELEVFLANQCLIRTCQRCDKATLWIQADMREEAAPAGVPPVGMNPPRHSIQERKSPRINLKVEVCLRSIEYGDEVVLSENVSKGGFRVVSKKDYALGSVFEAALPYSAKSANIFTPARIVYKDGGTGGVPFGYGFCYIPSPMAPSLTGMQISQARDA